MVFGDKWDEIKGALMVGVEPDQVSDFDHLLELILEKSGPDKQRVQVLLPIARVIIHSIDISNPNKIAEKLMVYYEARIVEGLWKDPVYASEDDPEALWMEDIAQKFVIEWHESSE